jgi:hypothetical protein
MSNMRWLLTAGAVCLTLAGSVSCSPDKADSGKKSDGKPTVAGKDPASSATKGQTSGQPTAKAAVAEWVKAIVEDRPEAACLVMGQPADGASPAETGTPATCEGKGAKAQQMKTQLHSMHSAFVPKPAPSNATVEVADVPTTDNTASVTGDQVTIDGQTLTAVVLSNSTGVGKDQLDLKLDAGKIKDSWYVTDFHLS